MFLLGRVSSSLTSCWVCGSWAISVGVLGQLAHPNIISLLGYCKAEGNGCLLVYEYIQNRNFAHFLFRDVAVPLSWGTRLKILLGVARGLAYLHSSEIQIIHRDVRTSNILLDQDFNAKLGDFGLPSFIADNRNRYVHTRAMYTYGHVDPMVEENGHLSLKGDIYSFGVVMLETLTGQPVGYTQIDLFRLVMKSPSMANKTRIKKIMDLRLEQNYSPKAAFDSVVLALRCVADYHADRPSSEEVLQSLEKIYLASSKDLFSFGVDVLKNPTYIM